MTAPDMRSYRNIFDCVNQIFGNVIFENISKYKEDIYLEINMWFDISCDSYLTKAIFCNILFEAALGQSIFSYLELLSNSDQIFLLWLPLRYFLILCNPIQSLS